VAWRASAAARPRVSAVSSVVRYSWLFLMGKPTPIEVTPEMIEAGLKVLESSGRLETTYLVGSDSLLVRQMFLQMLAHLLPSDSGEDQ